MTFDQLEYFYTVAQLCSFSKAAESIHISQPSLSISIKKLEAELGVHLFVPHRRSAVLTDAGRLFLQDVQKILQQRDVAITHMSQFSQKNQAEIRLAYTSAVANVYIPNLLKEFRSTNGNLYCIYSDEMPTEQIFQGIKEGHFELGIGSALPTDPELEQIPLFYQRLCLLLPETTTTPEHFASPHILNTLPFISYQRDYPMYRLLSSLFQHWNVQPNINFYAYSESAIARLVEQGLGISIVASTDGLQNYNVQQLYPDWLTEGRYIYLIRHRTRLLSVAAEALQKQILDTAQEITK